MLVYTKNELRISTPEGHAQGELISMNGARRPNPPILCRTKTGHVIYPSPAAYAEKGHLKDERQE